ncbi:hypothetical protein [Allocoleopsis sp.]|uniref:hypothetical protein n=1 Tax=Allocoleopsis sp. TaxID=3088169 RepID=UPI002FD39481
MFILEGSNNETDNALSAAHFELGTGVACYGALIAVIGSEGAETLILPAPNPINQVVEVGVKGLKINRLDAIEYMGRRYTRTLGKPEPGEFYCDHEVIKFRLVTYSQR